MNNPNIVISKTPYRLCIGGGTDLIPYVKRYGGQAFSTAIDKYITIVAQKRFDHKIRFHYALGVEEINRWQDADHPYIRATFKHLGFKGGIDIASFTDVPFASGLGSSGAFTVGLVNALWALSGVKKGPRDLAEEAAHIELNILKSPIGKHDQYLAAYGGICDLRFLQDGRVRVKKIKLSDKEKMFLETHLLLAHSGTTRSASRQLSPLFEQLRKQDNMAVQAMHDFRNAGIQAAEFIGSRDFINFGMHLNTLSDFHKKLVPYTEHLTMLIETGKKYGALGGMVSGAGGGGFIFFACPDPVVKRKVERAFSKKEIAVYPFKIEEQGSKIIFSK
jgi:D-glycero-alpha-D-manno-heptose-7-phosphate kinase